MSHKMRRVIVVTRNFAAMRDFYREPFDLRIV